MSVVDKDFLSELANYVVLQGVAVDSAVKVNVLPDSPDACVAIFGLPGEDPRDQRDIPELELPRFQVITRSADYGEASELLRKVRVALHGRIGLFLPHYRILRMHADQDGGPIGKDDAGRHEFSINFTVEHHYSDSLDA